MQTTSPPQIKCSIVPVYSADERLETRQMVERLREFEAADCKQQQAMWKHGPVVWVLDHVSNIPGAVREILESTRKEQPQEWRRWCAEHPDHETVVRARLEIHTNSSVGFEVEPRVVRPRVYERIQQGTLFVEGLEDGESRAFLLSSRQSDPILDLLSVQN